METEPKSLLGELFEAIGEVAFVVPMKTVSDILGGETETPEERIVKALEEIRNIRS